MENPGEDRGVDTGEIEAFWNLAKFHAKLNMMPGYFGPTTLEVVTPPSFTLGETPDESEAAVLALLATSQTTLSSTLAELGEETPQVGMLGIVLDGVGHPRALVETVAVHVEGEVVTEELKVRYEA